MTAAKKTAVRPSRLEVFVGEMIDETAAWAMACRMVDRWVLLDEAGSPDAGGYLVAAAAAEAHAERCGAVVERSWAERLTDAERTTIAQRYDAHRQPHAERSEVSFVVEFERIVGRLIDAGDDLLNAAAVYQFLAQAATMWAGGLRVERRAAWARRQCSEVGPPSRDVTLAELAGLVRLLADTDSVPTDSVSYRMHYHGHVYDNVAAWRKALPEEAGLVAWAEHPASKLLHS